MRVPKVNGVFNDLGRLLTNGHLPNPKQDLIQVNAR